eukprot:14946808-Alexandrium_andersonii.AAC.1
MSASLVGSEMCIRDSNMPARRKKAQWPRCGAKLATKAAQTPEGGGKGTVSYTHLTLPTICSV